MNYSIFLMIFWKKTVNGSDNALKKTTVLESPSCVSHEDEADLWAHTYMLSDHDGALHKKWNKETWCKPSCIPITIILILIFLVVLLPLLDHAMTKADHSTSIKPEDLCRNSCRLSLVESIPDGLKYPDGTAVHRSTASTWLDLISTARESIEIASFYWTLRQSEIYPDPSSVQGEKVFQALLNAGTKRNISIKIAQNSPTREQPNTDTEYLVKRKAADVRSLNFVQLLGGGVLHTKFWIIDRKHFYVGSANMDWRALTQVKELGVVAYNCTCLAEDMGKIFDVYWFLGNSKVKIPTHWPISFGTDYNIDNPLKVNFSNYTFHSFISSSPPPFSAYGRTDDINAILHVIQTAEKFIYIAVMDYSPQFLFTPKIKYWPVIDDALRVAAIEHSVKVRLLISLWNHTKSSEDHFLKSLVALNNVHSKVSIEVGYFVVPANNSQRKIPYARVNHNKYMVTDNTAYVGTSNWSADYFTDTAGVGLIMHDPELHRNETENTIRKELEAVFERDWNSNYTISILQTCNE
ncbi:phospholipase D3 isoform X3 [Agrilus planipennis]|uniref:Phospholipase D3 isoform X3 n=1 Tax=Agrilus planipennis TaxID=224129 RepID=A0A7F5RMY5_AGRPL|nr:phospholipase D3 isoform X3 [Agrilus planipennis]